MYNKKRLIRSLFIMYMVPWVLVLITLVIALTMYCDDTRKLNKEVSELKDMINYYEIHVSELNTQIQESSTRELTIEICEPRAKEIDENELEMLTNLIAAEAGSDWCSDTMQAYVASVILNRMASDLYPNTMEEVIFQDGQYACAKDGVIVWNYDENVYARAKSMAKWILSNGSELPSNVVFQAQFKQGDGVYKQIQNMYFCYKN